MGSFYFDTSALVKLYFEEEGTPEVLRIAEDQEKNRLVILDIAQVELRSAVRQRERDGDIPQDLVASVLESFDQDLGSAYIVQPMNANVLQEATHLLDADAHPRSAHAALHLAGCLVACANVPQPVTFVCADEDLCTSARREGFRVLNPVKAGAAAATEN